MEFFLFLPQLRLTIEQLVQRATAAEDAGFTGIALMDHLAPPGTPESPMFEAMTAATWIAARTQRLRVGHLVLCDAFRHPVMLARQAVTLDHASGGRFELGLGSGSVPEELVRFGLGDPGARTRVERLGETLEVLRLLWSGERVSFAGRHHHLQDVVAHPTPTRPLPLVIGGTGPRMLALVAEHADWWNLPLGQLSRLEELAPQAGRARVSVQQMVTWVPDEARRAEVVEPAARRFAAMAGADGLVTGTASQLLPHFAALAARGVQRCYVWFTDFASPATLSAFGEVIAAF